MRHTSVLVLSDNQTVLNGFIDLLGQEPDLSADRTFTFACYAGNDSLADKTLGGHPIEPLNVKKEARHIGDKFDLVISAHCKQIFPDELVKAVTCINIHPGYNPYNRGWYPQVFSILNGLPLGATIHEIDTELDHGDIIDQERIELRPDDTSRTAYDRVLGLEIKLLSRNLESILDGTYEAHPPKEEGNVNYRKDFDALCELDPNERLTSKEVIDRLRALTHPPYKNAYFIDPTSGEHVWVEVALRAEGSDHEQAA
ncbi:MAG TPA: dTDP-4-amino-4,6-dideoxyglucose formyltransferase [Verrucomicrobiae bacterium]|nr:dTDP-4-amino-4,6-dideoxyglucose formyltransferase [Verrucomicrobiae bacterium]